MPSRFREWEIRRIGAPASNREINRKELFVGWKAQKKTEFYSKCWNKFNLVWLEKGKNAILNCIQPFYFLFHTSPIRRVVIYSSVGTFTLNCLKIERVYTKNALWMQDMILGAALIYNKVDKSQMSNAICILKCNAPSTMSTWNNR